MNNNEKIIEKYIKAAIKHGEGTESGNHKLANKSYKIIEESINQLKSIDNGINELEKLLEHEEGYVKLWTASYLLSIEEEKAKKTLLELSNKSGFLGFTAMITLEEWNKKKI